MVNYDLGQFAADPAKAQVREKELEALLRTFPDSTQRSQLKVVHLTGPSLSEYDQVFAKAGIPAQNVLGVDCGVDAYAKVSQENNERKPWHKIRIEPWTLSHAFTQGKYDIVSMDFDANFGPNVVESISSLFANDALTDKSLLYINTQGRRENKASQKRLILLGCIATQALANYANFATSCRKSFSNTAFDANDFEIGLTRDRIKILRDTMAAVDNDYTPSAVGREFVSSEILIGALCQPAIGLTDEAFIDAYERWGNSNQKSEYRALMTRALDVFNQASAKVTMAQDPSKDTLSLAYKLALDPISFFNAVAQMKYPQQRSANFYTSFMIALQKILTVDDVSFAHYTSSSNCAMHGQIYSLSRSHITDNSQRYYNIALSPIFSEFKRIAYSSKPEHVSLRNFFFRNLKEPNLTIESLLVNVHNIPSSFRGLQTFRSLLRKSPQESGVLLEFHATQRRGLENFAEKVYSSVQKAVDVAQSLHNRIGGSIFLSPPQERVDVESPVKTISESSLSAPLEPEVELQTEVPARKLTNEEKEIVRELISDQSITPKQIFTDLFTGSGVSPNEVYAICARAKHKASWEKSSGIIIG